MTWLAVFCCYKPKLKSDAFYRFISCRKTRRRRNEENSLELLSSLMKKNEVEKPGLEEIANGITDLSEAITITKRYKEIIKT